MRDRRLDQQPFRQKWRRRPLKRRAERLGQLNARQRQALASLRGQETITNAQYRRLIGAPERTASLDLKTLVDLGFLRRQGKGRDTSYLLGTQKNPQ